MKPIDAKTNEHYVAMLEKAADSYAKRSPGGLEQGRRQAQQAAEFRLKGARGAKRRKLTSVIASCLRFGLTGDHLLPRRPSPWSGYRSSSLS